MKNENCKMQNEASAFRNFHFAIFIFQSLFLLASTACAAPTSQPAGDPSRYFAIEVVDDQTGRGVPLVELKTVANVRYYTDSAGLVAIDDPVLTGRTVFFHVTSHGYEFPADGFGIRGKRLDVTPGGTARIKIKRLNIAERLYRVTGEGIYCDSVMLGRPVPIMQPLLNGQVSGQDSVQGIVYRDRLWWFWGDTNRPSYPLGHFGTSGATSLLPGKGGLDPSAGVDLEYFTDTDGFSRPMFEPVEGRVHWLDALMLLPDDSGAERLLGMEGLFKDLGHCTGRRLCVLDDQKQRFQTLQEIPLDAPLYPSGYPFRVTEGKQQWYYFARAFPDIRVKADLASVRDPSSYEAFTCLAAGARYEREKTRLDRDADGKLVWAWKRDTAPLDSEQIIRLVKAHVMKEEEAWLRPIDPATGKPILLHGGSVTYNAFRQKWIMIAGQAMGDSSFLGEIWYLESDKPQGPWTQPRKIVTHDRYSLYNPRQHPFFDQQGGRIIYFEGTYASTFSRTEDPTPRYDYNQMMYRLDLADPRLELTTPKSNSP